tara:strand:- start:6169 stop:6852 length:684 start_codon:yes stop_codon:yes gene_type:complete
MSLKPGSFLYEIVHSKSVQSSEPKIFYVQNHEDYLRNLEKNYNYYGVPFKKPNVEEIPPYVHNITPTENHIEYLDTVSVKLNVLKNGKVRVKLLTQMATLNENYYSKAKVPPIKNVLSALKAHGYSKEFINITEEKYKKRQKLIRVKGEKLDKYFDTPSMSSKARKKGMKKKKEKEKEKENIEDIQEDDEDDEVRKDDDPEEDEGLDVEQDEEDVVEDEYISDGGDD